MIIDPMPYAARFTDDNLAIALQRIARLEAIIREARLLGHGPCWREGCTCKNRGHNSARVGETLDEAERRVDCGEALRSE